LTLYADASAVMKLYLDEVDSDAARRALRDDPVWITTCITAVEVRRNLSRLLADHDLERARTEFERDWSEVVSLSIDDAAAAHAAELAERTGVKSLDALHLEGARRAGADDGLPIVTFDRRMADAARSLGWRVLPE
jgi:predicted nucleic acid-binding protein